VKLCTLTQFTVSDPTRNELVMFNGSVCRPKRLGADEALEMAIFMEVAEEKWQAWPARFGCGNRMCSTPAVPTKLRRFSPRRKTKDRALPLGSPWFPPGTPRCSTMVAPYDILGAHSFGCKKYLCRIVPPGIRALTWIGRNR
jgi:hypothetical protein